MLGLANALRISSFVMVGFPFLGKPAKAGMQQRVVPTRAGIRMRKVFLLFKESKRAVQAPSKEK
jgi:hypothetical protein